MIKVNKPKATPASSPPGSARLRAHRAASRSTSRAYRWTAEARVEVYYKTWPELQYAMIADYDKPAHGRN